MSELVSCSPSVVAYALRKYEEAPAESRGLVLRAALLLTPERASASRAVATLPCVPLTQKDSVEETKRRHRRFRLLFDPRDPADACSPDSGLSTADGLSNTSTSCSVDSSPATQATSLEEDSPDLFDCSSIFNLHEGTLFSEGETAVCRERYGEVCCLSEKATKSQCSATCQQQQKSTSGSRCCTPLSQDVDLFSAGVPSISVARSAAPVSEPSLTRVYVSPAWLWLLGWLSEGLLRLRARLPENCCYKRQLPINFASSGKIRRPKRQRPLGGRHTQRRSVSGIDWCCETLVMGGAASREGVAGPAYQTCNTGRNFGETDELEDSDGYIQDSGGPHQPPLRAQTGSSSGANEAFVEGFDRKDVGRRGSDVKVQKKLSTKAAQAPTGPNTSKTRVLVHGSDVEVERPVLEDEQYLAVHGSGPNSLGAVSAASTRAPGGRSDGGRGCERGDDETQQQQVGGNKASDVSSRQSGGGANQGCGRGRKVAGAGDGDGGDEQEGYRSKREPLAQSGMRAREISQQRREMIDALDIKIASYELNADYEQWKLLYARERALVVCPKFALFLRQRLGPDPMPQSADVTPTAVKEPSAHETPSIGRETSWTEALAGTSPEPPSATGAERDYNRSLREESHGVCFRGSTYGGSRRESVAEGKGEGEGQRRKDDADVFMDESDSSLTSAYDDETGGSATRTHSFATLSTLNVEQRHIPAQRNITKMPHNNDDVHASLPPSDPFFRQSRSNVTRKASLPLDISTSAGSSGPPSSTYSNWSDFAYLSQIDSSLLLTERLSFAAHHSLPQTQRETVVSWMLKCVESLNLTETVYSVAVHAMDSFLTLRRVDSSRLTHRGCERFPAGSWKNDGDSCKCDCVTGRDLERYFNPGLKIEGLNPDSTYSSSLLFTLQDMCAGDGLPAVGECQIPLISTACLCLAIATEELHSQGKVTMRFIGHVPGVSSVAEVFKQQLEVLSRLKRGLSSSLTPDDFLCYFLCNLRNHQQYGAFYTRLLLHQQQRSGSRVTEAEALSRRGWSQAHASAVASRRSAQPQFVGRPHVLLGVTCKEPGCKLSIPGLDTLMRAVLFLTREAFERGVYAFLPSSRLVASALLPILTFLNESLETLQSTSEFVAGVFRLDYLYELLPCYFHLLPYFQAVVDKHSQSDNIDPTVQWLLNQVFHSYTVPVPNRLVSGLLDEIYGSEFRARPQSVGRTTPLTLVSHAISSEAPQRGAPNQRSKPLLSVAHKSHQGQSVGKAASFRFGLHTGTTQAGSDGSVSSISVSPSTQAHNECDSHLHHPNHHHTSRAGHLQERQGVAQQDSRSLRNKITSVRVERPQDESSSRHLPTNSRGKSHSSGQTNDSALCATEHRRTVYSQSQLLEEEETLARQPSLKQSDGGKRVGAAGKPITISRSSLNRYAGSSSDVRKGGDSIVAEQRPTVAATSTQRVTTVDKARPQVTGETFDDYLAMSCRGAEGAPSAVDNQQLGKRRLSNLESKDKGRTASTKTQSHRFLKSIFGNTGRFCSLPLDGYLEGNAAAVREDPKHSNVDDDRAKRENDRGLRKAGSLAYASCRDESFKASRNAEATQSQQSGASLWRKCSLTKKTVADERVSGLEHSSVSGEGVHTTARKSLLGNGSATRIISASDQKMVLNARESSQSQRRNAQYEHAAAPSKASSGLQRTIKRALSSRMGSRKLSGGGKQGLKHLAADAVAGPED